MGRFSYGVTPALAAKVIAAGGASKWFEQQLNPGVITDAATDALLEWYPSLSRGPQDLWQRQIQEIEGGWEVMADYARWVLLRRMHTKRQVLETMTEFWENHLNVPVWGDATFTWRTSYGAAIRRHALGRFDDLLHATITHPAMLIYLDGAVSTAVHPNENLGRELLELHTVGRGNYTEDDVKGSARILTGWSVDMWDTWAASYTTEDHWRGPVAVMGFTDANTAADGRDLTRRYLSYLAHHPATAQRIAHKLAVKFVGDNPPGVLVDKLAAVYLDNDTAIKPVLRALVASTAFQNAAGSKVRDPGEDIVATYRALGVKLQPPPEGDAGNDYAATAMLWQAENLGTSPFAWPRPDGQPIDNDSWSSPTRLIASMDVHWSMSGGWWPSVGITYPEPMDWMPKPSMRFNKLVDHLCQQLLHRRSTPRLLRACCEATDVGPTEKITADHGLVRWEFYRLLGTLLDSPAHLTR
ncbi:MAG: hypothetical protein JWO11_737 [Nocardioides sp.]|nr:hypothetical protein [Nocardioides sp.]